MTSASTTKPKPMLCALSEAEVQERLEWAGLILARLNLSPTGPAGLRGYWPDFAPELSVAYGYADARWKPATPSPQEITQMDQTLRWVQLIPVDQFVLRRVVNARLLMNPYTERHLFTYKAVGKMLGCDWRAAMRWRQQGVEIIASKLPKAS